MATTPHTRPSPRRPLALLLAVPVVAAALPSAVLPLVVAALATAVLSGLLAGGSARRRLGLLLTGALAAGASSATVLDPALGVLHGSWIATTAAAALNVLAIAAFVAGLQALLGERRVA